MKAAPTEIDGNIQKIIGKYLSHIRLVGIHRGIGKSQFENHYRDFDTLDENTILIGNCEMFFQDSILINISIGRRTHTASECVSGLIIPEKCAFGEVSSILCMNKIPFSYRRQTYDGDEYAQLYSEYGDIYHFLFVDGGFYLEKIGVVLI